MALVETGVVKIESINKYGCGLGKTSNGKNICVQYTLPGEVVEYELHQSKNKINATLKKHIETSPSRESNKCKYYTQCGGCLLQHLNHHDYIKVKTEQIQFWLQQYKISYNIAPLISVGIGKRRRANFEYSKREDKSYFGFHKYQLNQIINIDECPSVRAEISTVIPNIKTLLDQILETKQKANIYVTLASNGLDILVRIKNFQTLDNSLKKLIQNFFDNNQCCRVKITNKKNIIFLIEKETPYINFEDTQVEINPDSFLQSSYESDFILLNLIKKYLQLDQKDQLVDLFSGRGTFSIPLSKICSVGAFESEKNSIDSLNKAAINNNLQIKALQRDLFEAPLYPHELNKYTKAIINPPRAGSLSQIKELAQSNISKICYVSCNPETFARDAKILVHSKYQIVEITPVDQFVWNPHIEVVALFEKNA